MSDDEYDVQIRLIACRPVNLGDMSPLRQKMWARVTAEVGFPLHVYEGSIHRPCQRCTIPVAIGPRQQQQMKEWDAAGIEYRTMCLICAVEDVAVETSDEEGPVVVQTMSLGNPGNGRGT